MRLYYKYINTRFRINLISYFLEKVFIEIIYIIINYIKIILRFYKN